MHNKLSMVVAVDALNGIGKDGSIPWKDSLDMKWFSYVTTKEYIPGKRNAVIMGRVTWDSLPKGYKPLPNRLNVVITRNPLFNTPLADVQCSLVDAITTCMGNEEVGRVFIIGGSSIYEEVLKDKRLSEVYISRIPGNFKCDTFFSMDKLYELGGFKHFDNLAIASLFIHRFTRPDGTPEVLGTVNLKTLTQNIPKEEACPRIS